MKVLKIILTAAFLCFNAMIIFSGCKQRVRKLKSPPHYSFSAVIEYKLDLHIKEISGLVWDKERHSFIAHNDEKAKLFFLDKDDPRVITSEIEFGGKGDYEDIAIANGNIYILKSDGVITKFNQDSSGKAYGTEYQLELTGKKDFEAMYYDETRKALIIICKNCDIDSKSSVSAFAFYPDSARFDEKPVYTINADQIKNLAPVKTSKFQPSAAAVHPVLKKLIIISSASNQLVIADMDGNPESVYHLSQTLFPQPEGITFKGSGDMFISNEAVTSKSTILKFDYKL
jgi:uncharacterized protein YjiK